MMMNRDERYMELVNSTYVTDLDNNTEYDEYFFIEIKDGIDIETIIQINYSTRVISGEQVINENLLDMSNEQVKYYIEYLRDTDELLRELPENKVERTNDYERWEETT